MSSPYLEDYKENAEYELEIALPIAIKETLTNMQAQSVCMYFRQRGACELLLTGEPDALYVNLMQSAALHQHYLHFAPENDKVTSRAMPFYDAIGGGYWECAEDIAKHSRLTWNQKHELEEDFLFVLFIIKHFFLGADEDECRSIIERHDEAAEGADSEYRDVCEAFLDEDSDALHDAICALLDVRAARLDKMAENESLPDEILAWSRYFSIEAFALLRLAEKKGIKTAINYSQIPEVARKSPGFKFEPDSWKSLHFAP
ncbi:hypothetical protein [Hahella sp. NBU794]|uniref:hypothetical protein n=1 Tax=Hahella sp. NBU794 TaxID=3422590 RepID=UPI003D6E05E6